MSGSLYGSESRRPVMYRGERIPGPFERTTNDGRLVYDLRRKVEGRMVRRTLTATTPTDAIREARSTTAKVEDGMRIVGREDATLAQLREAFEAWARGTASTLAPSTVVLYLLRLDQHVIPALARRGRRRP